MRPKVRALTRLQTVYSVQELLNQFKSHIWSYVEYHSGALLLACDTDKERLEKMQRSFLHQVHVSEEDAFVHYAFAPLCLRRAIGTLGFLHKRVLGHCHPELKKTLPMASPDYFQWHEKTIDASSIQKVTEHLPLYHRSIWRYVHILCQTEVSKWRCFLAHFLAKLCGCAELFLLSAVALRSASEP